MRRADDPKAAALAAEIQAFVEQNRSLIRLGSTAARAWFQALRDQRWYVPHWPVAFGGLDWNPLQTYIWQRELLRAQALLPSGATTQLVASWIFGWLPQQSGPIQAQGQRWLAGIAGEPHPQFHRHSHPYIEQQISPVTEPEAELWRVGVDLRRPDWVPQALAGTVLTEQAHWVLQPYRLEPEGCLEPVQGCIEPENGTGSDPEEPGCWALGVYPGALLPPEPHLPPQEAEKLNPDLSPKGLTEVELGVEQRWPPILSGLTLTEVEALLRPVQLAWQNPGAPVGALDRVEQGLLVPSIELGWRLERVQQVLAADGSLETELEGLHESQIALVALQVMEARAAQADTTLEPQVPGADLLQVVGQSAERLGWRIAQLEANSLGYFALPVFDEQLQHNEGPVTPALYDPLVRRPVK